MTILIYAFVTLQVLDVLSTIVALNAGAVEGNPLYYILGLPLFMLGKVLSVSIMVAAVVFIKDISYIPYVKRAVMIVLVVASAVVVVWNMSILLR